MLNERRHLQEHVRIVAIEVCQHLLGVLLPEDQVKERQDSRAVGLQALCRAALCLFPAFHQLHFCCPVLLRQPVCIDIHING